MCCAESSTICARRQVTTDPVPRRTMRSSRWPSSLLIGRTCTGWAISHLLRGSQDQTRRQSQPPSSAGTFRHPRGGRRLAAAALEGGPTVNTTRLTVTLQVVADVDLDEVAARD